MRKNLPVTQNEFRLSGDQTLVSVTDLKGRITYCNDAFAVVSGFTMAELLGQPHNLVRHPDIPEEAFRDLWATISSGLPWSGLIKNRRKNGDFYWVRANATPLYSGDSIVGYLSVRTVPEAAEVAAAAALYARMQDEAAAGKLRIGIEHGTPVRRDLVGRTLEALKPGLRAKIATPLLVSSGITVAAACWQPLAGVAAACATSALSAWFVLRATIAPLREAVDDANRLAAGDLTRVVRTGGPGSIGQMQGALAQLSVNLRTVIGDARNEIEKLRGSIHEITAGNHELSARTEAQASSLQQTAVSMGNIRGRTQQAAASASQGATMSQQMASLASRSQEAVEGVAQSMQAINGASQRVGEIIHVIEGVAFQTNILALNAAVEAARAGEAGRGFAVVASEVRALAGRTSEAAREIKQLINESAQRVAEGNNQTTTAAQRMREAFDSVQRTTQLLSEIRESTSEQENSMAEVGDAISHMDSITQQNTAMVEELAASATTLGRQADHVMETTRLLRLRRGDKTLAEVDAVALRRQARELAEEGDAA